MTQEIERREERLEIEVAAIKQRTEKIAKQLEEAARMVRISGLAFDKVGQPHRPSYSNVVHDLSIELDYSIVNLRVPLLAARAARADVLRGMEI